MLANLLVSMSDTDFKAFKSSQDIDLSFLGDNGGRRLLCAAVAAKLAVVYSQYDSLYVLTNAVIQGTCLLSYSFSMECPSSEKQSYLLQAKEAFEIGLLTKTEGHLVTSKQELHTFVMAAYSLLVTHKWLGSPVDIRARTACKEAVEKLYTYFHTDNQEKDDLSIEVVNLVTHVKSLLSIEPFPNSDKGSFIPDSYRSIHERKLSFTLDGFSQMIRRFQQYHASVCESSETGCKRMSVERVEGLHSGLCITALGTLDTEHASENYKPHTDSHSAEFNIQIQLNVSDPQPQCPEGQEFFCPTLGSTDVPPSVSADKIPSKPVGKSNERAVVENSSLNHSLASSWQNIATDSTGTPPSQRGSQERDVLNRGDVQYQCDPFCLSTEASEDGSEMGLRPFGESKDRTGNCGRPVFNPSERSSPPSQVTSCPHTGGYIQPFEVLNQQMETVMSDELWPAGNGLGVAATQSQSPAKSRTPSSSLSDSVGSLSSWEKLSPIHPCCPIISPGAMVNTHPLLLPQSLANPELLDKSSLETQNTKSPTTDQSFVHIETTNGPISGAALETEMGFVVVSHPQNQYSFSVDPETASVPIGPDPRGSDHYRPQPALKESSPEQCLSTEMGSSFELIEKEIKHLNIDEQSGDVEEQNPSHINPSCYTCQNHGMVGSVVPGKQYLLTQLDYNAFLAGLCHGCLLKRLQSNMTQFKLRKHQSAYNALQLKYSRVTELWTARETYVYIGEPMGAEGKQRTALWVQSLHQEERLGSYVAKDYLKPKEIQFHLNDVERQMTAQYYVTQFNKTLYNHKVTAQIFFIPSEVLLILKDDEIVGCVTMEPYMQGDFVKLTNNTGQVVKKLKATEYGIAFGHFTYLFSNCQEVVVDLQGWVTANGKGLTYLTDPQIHSLRTPKGVSNFAERGLRYFLEEQHGPNCNDICKLLNLAPMGRTCSSLPFP